MIILNQVNPPMEEYLEHFGVLGMKWGQRKKATGPQIRQARRDVKSSQAAIKQQRKVVRKTDRGSAQRTKEKAKLEKMRDDYMKDPNRFIAARMTRGEKVLAVVLTAPSGGVGGLSAIAASSIISRSIEQHQDRMKANPKK